MCTKYAFKFKTKFQQTWYIPFEGVPEMQILLASHQNADVRFALFGQNTQVWSVASTSEIWPKVSTFLVGHSSPIYLASLHSYVETLKKTQVTNLCQPWYKGYPYGISSRYATTKTFTSPRHTGWNDIYTYTWSEPLIIFVYYTSPYLLKASLANVRLIFYEVYFFIKTFLSWNVGRVTICGQQNKYMKHICSTLSLTLHQQLYIPLKS